MFVAGAIDAFDYDIPDMIGMLQDKERKYESWVSKIAHKYKKKADSYHIYQYGDSFSDPSYWFNMYKAVGYCGGMATSLVALVVAIGGVGIGIGGVRGAVLLCYTVLLLVYKKLMK